MGYVGSGNAWEIVMGGLRRLEYRGYDSTGIATVSGKRLHLARRVGQLSALQESLPNGLPGSIGIGHTRWATHGGVTESNCHPHLDSKQRIALVHNGIIDNADVLRAELATSSVKFRSETDTEVLAELIGRSVDAGLNLREAVIAALKRVEGTAGIIALDLRDPERLVAARVGSPVVVGLGEQACWVASDSIALRPYTDRMIVLDEGEVAELLPNAITTFDLEQRTREKRIEKILHQPDDADIGQFQHFMLKEIHDQPAAIDRSMRGRLDTAFGTARLGGLTAHESRLLDIRRVVFCGCGTSLYSAEVGAALVRHYARLPATAEDASELSVRNPIVDRETLYVAISQSGETADTLAALREIRMRGGLVAGITNVVGSSLSRETDFGIYVHAGPEISVASTKAFTAQVLATELLALRFARMRDLSAADGRAWVAGLENLPRQVGLMLEQAPLCEELAERFQKAPFTMFVGRGLNLPVASEGALKLKEISYMPAEGLSGGAMKHGPLALIEPGSPVWALVPPDETRARMLGNLRELKARGAFIMALAAADDDETKSIADRIVRLPPHHPAVSPILSVVPLQLYAYYVAKANGHSIDRPRNLAKSLTVM
jgi:glucosamine--fructose-6-phosphate aminotransferase (isomerizing)